MPHQPGLRVLVIAAPAESVEPWAGALRAAGHQVDVVTDGPSALRLAHAAPPDVVVLDAAGLGGALARGIEEQAGWRKPFVIALVEPAQPLSPRPSADAGIDLHLVKPLDPDGLLGLLRRFQRIVQDVEGFDPGI